MQTLYIPPFDGQITMRSLRYHTFRDSRLIAMENGPFASMIYEILIYLYTYNPIKHAGFQ